MGSFRTFWRETCEPSGSVGPKAELGPETKASERSATWVEFSNSTGRVARETAAHFRVDCTSQYVMLSDPRCHFWSLAQPAKPG